jgi:hypothetical protein
VEPVTDWEHYSVCSSDKILIWHVSKYYLNSFRSERPSYLKEYNGQRLDAGVTCAVHSLLQQRQQWLNAETNKARRMARNKLYKQFHFRTKKLSRRLIHRHQERYTTTNLLTMVLRAVFPGDSQALLWQRIFVFYVYGLGSKTISRQGVPSSISYMSFDINAHWYSGVSFHWIAVSDSELSLFGERWNNNAELWRAVRKILDLLLSEPKDRFVIESLVVLKWHFNYTGYKCREVDG